MNVTAVCVSKSPERAPLDKIPFYNYTAGWKPFGHEKSIARIQYLSGRRNVAVREALQSYPSTEHLLMIDSYYLMQGELVLALLDEYRKLTETEHRAGCILGASNWIYDKTRIWPRYRFYDSWTTPEASEFQLSDAIKKGGIFPVKAVGGCYVYPRYVWENVGYGVPEDLHGCEHNWLCEKSGLPVFLSLNERLWREPIVYPWSKRIRVSVHLGRIFNSLRKKQTSLNHSRCESSSPL